MIRASKQNLKKSIKEIKDLKKKLAYKEALMKLQIDKLNRCECEVTQFKDEEKKLKKDGAKAKEEIKKLKTELKQAITELEKSRDRAVDLMEVNSKVIVNEFKKSLSFKSS